MEDNIDDYSNTVYPTKFPYPEGKAFSVDWKSVMFNCSVYYVLILSLVLTVPVCFITNALYQIIINVLNYEEFTSEQVLSICKTGTGCSVVGILVVVLITICFTRYITENCE